MKHLKFFLAIAIIVIITGIVAAIIISFQKMDEPGDLRNDREIALDSDETEVKGEATIEAEEIKYTESEEGKTIWEITAGEAKFYKEQDITEFEKINVTFYYQDEYKLILYGDRGELNNETKNITLNDNVEIEAADKYKLITDSLRYSAEKDQIDTEDPIFVTGPDISFSGRGFTFNLADEELFINSDVVTDFTEGSSEGDEVIETKEEGPESVNKESGFEDVTSLDSPLRISSNSLYGNRKKNLIRYTGGTTATYKDATLNASTLTIYFEGDEEVNITRIEARGNVRLTQPDYSATSGLLVFDYKTKVLTLTGNPVIWSGENIVKGDEILYFLDENRAEVIGKDENRAYLTLYPEEEFTIE